MRLFSWNVNGIRAAQRGGFLDWLGKETPDILSLQEVKARPEQLDEELARPEGYHTYWHPATCRNGYSGVAIYSKTRPEEIRHGIGAEDIDREGRVLIAEYPAFTLVNAYFPNSQREHARLDYKLYFCKTMLEYLDHRVREGRHIILCGDYNIAHQEIDLKNPKSNMNNAGFLPEERAWMSEFLKSGYKDVFREQTRDPDQYTWWSYRPGVREKNIGWRLDYHCVNEGFMDKVGKARHHPGVRGSDHCPVELEVKA